MAVGVATANAILLVTFAEQNRLAGQSASQAAVLGAAGRLRAIVMTSCAMIAGMLPMALGLGEAGEQNAPLGRSVIGGLLAATFATLFILPGIFALAQEWATTKSPSLDRAIRKADILRPLAPRRGTIEYQSNDRGMSARLGSPHCRWPLGSLPTLDSVLSFSFWLAATRPLRTRMRILAARRIVLLRPFRRRSR